MSSKPIITVENLGKKYRINESSIGNYRRLMEELALWYKNRNKSKVDEREFWALQGLNFTVDAGETVGIIGSNGSGKSTLLKILARVTWPTTGRVEIFGRVSALLEVGTGFHLDLSGRENVFLSGAMLGMKKAEVTRHFDEIVEFSGVEKFLDTPVKKYSSGMFLRLAFSIMTHLRSDILIIDEILAVGDAQFQEKCIHKMRSIVREGRTILFVSHQFEKIRSLCKKTIWIKEGHLFHSGPTADVLSHYEEYSHLLAEPIL
ncbi:MAG TPA: ABC transporter ATP-binding protein [Rhabdochlamydiaceae bacterium]|nr:ABC transporter ATP-binding protein [Rhabdochlamydiaceae bacterium]